MISKIIIALVVFSSQAYAQELPSFLVFPNILLDQEIRVLHQLTYESTPEQQWYGRATFWQEIYEAKVSEDGESIIFNHEKESKFLAIIDKLTSLWLRRLPELGADLRGKRIILETYLDRNVVEPENMGSSGMFWHRDSIHVDGSKKIADYSMILLMNGKNQEWEGADLILQQGGSYKEKNSYVWVNSENPLVTIRPVYNQAIIFRNLDSGHMVTPLKPLSHLPIFRDVFITTCHLLKD